MVWKVLKSRKTTKLHDWFKSHAIFFFYIYCQDQQQHPAVPAEGVSRDRSVAVTCYMWNMTGDFFLLAKKVLKKNKKVHTQKSKKVITGA